MIGQSCRRGTRTSVSSSRTSISTSSMSSGSSTRSTLFRNTTMCGTLTWWASRTCSRVCGIGPSSAPHDEDRAVHLGGAGDHVLDVVGVARAVDVSVVALLGLVLDVSGRDGDAARALFGSLVDLVESSELRVADAAVVRGQASSQRSASSCRGRRARSCRRSRAACCGRTSASPSLLLSFCRHREGGGHTVMARPAPSACRTKGRQYTAGAVARANILVHVSGRFTRAPWRRSHWRSAPALRRSA